MSDYEILSLVVLLFTVFTAWAVALFNTKK